MAIKHFDDGNRQPAPDLSRMTPTSRLRDLPTFTPSILSSLIFATRPYGVEPGIAPLFYRLVSHVLPASSLSSPPGSFPPDKTKPPLALVKLLKVLDRHPDLLAEVRSA